MLEVEVLWLDETKVELFEQNDQRYRGTNVKSPNYRGGIGSTTVWGCFDASGSAKSGWNN